MDDPFIERSGGRARAFAHRFMHIFFGSILVVLLGIVRFLAPVLRVVCLLMVAAGALGSALLAGHGEVKFAIQAAGIAIAFVVLRMALDRLVTVRIDLR